MSQLAHSARRALGSPDLIAGSTELRLDPDRIACDLWEFDAARRSGALEGAAALYGGPFLDGFFLSESPEFERWTESRRSALAREYQETLEGLAVQAELGGDRRGAAEWWRRLAEHEPLSSRVTMHLMTALAASGERAKALEHARAYQIQMREELEADPNPAVLALASQLKRMATAAGPDARAHETALPRTLSLGVLPLVALEGDRESRSTAQGLTEELTSAAAELPGIRVASRTSIAAAQQATTDARQIGARLGLEALLEGTVRQSGGRMRLTVRLVDARDGCQTWTGRYDREVSEGFEGQEALARSVVAELRARLEAMARQDPELHRE
ncbi:MAG: hypothetical protein H0W67_04230 [Gemmatimonadales bacterium]|nr:hypothetical protein [Gemmatimonadales bacterium]